MINKIEAPHHRPHNPVTNVQQSPHLRPDKVAQVIPAQSVMSIAHSALGSDILTLQGMPTDLDAMLETQENIGFALAGRSSSTSGSSSSSSERARPRAMLQRLARQVAVVAPNQSEELRQRIPAIEQVEEVDDLLNSMRKHELDAGEMALLLATMLNDSDLSPTRRRRLEMALERVMKDDDWKLQLFGLLEFGGLGPAGLAELRRLYQQAASRQSGLAYWFAQFRQLLDRRRKLKTLIRALSFELSAEFGISDIRLGAVITDLKRILQFLTIEDHCDRMARALNSPGVDGDRITTELLEIIQQSWVYPDWLKDRATQMLPEGYSQHGYARRMVDLVKMLPDDCFEDIEQRETVLQAFTEYQEKLVNEEEEEY
ncbi:type III secretion system gatekeeper subunit SctW [Winslowiella iniecta]|uniref:Secretion protein n=1 Tax=Winslowiella iniecta TaxID=1560201 RepID=A0A0L7TCP8_9GAMM|nr:type III secretion system gatekeeper subunit SctW [Winslowiella iniecta]KOC90709.1 secretion protein [Winslowiella iniecta]KOC93133.1 secretion protein [Winslowiella iniecta]